MKTAHLIAILSLISVLPATGCIKSNPAQTKVQTPYGTMRHHCPPGQAKKGNCQSIGAKGVHIH